MKKILIVEDAIDIRTMISNFLTKKGYEVIQVEDGEKAISYLETKLECDLMLLDIITPNQDGFDVLSYIDENKIDIPVIAMSGGGRTISGDSALKAVESKAKAVIKKPFTGEKILQLIEKVS